MKSALLVLIVAQFISVVININAHFVIKIKIENNRKEKIRSKKKKVCKKTKNSKRGNDYSPEYKPASVFALPVSAPEIRPFLLLF